MYSLGGWVLIAWTWPRPGAAGVVLHALITTLLFTIALSLRRGDDDE